MTNYLVTGATGQLGRGIVENLLRRVPAAAISVLVRDRSKADSLAALGVGIRQGDYQDRASLDAAFKGIDKLMFVSTTAFSDAVTQHQNVVAAASKAGVKHIAYTGIQRPERSNFVMSQVTKWELATEKALRESEMAVTLLRNALYLDALPFMFGDQVMATGIRAPAGSQRAAVVARADLAEAAALVLSQSGHEGRTYTLGGSEALSMADIAATLSFIGRKQVTYANITREAFVAERIAAGLPEPVAGFVSEWFLAVAAGEFAEVTGDLERLIGRKPVGAAEFLSNAMRDVLRE